MLPVKTIRVRAFRSGKHNFRETKFGRKYLLRHRDKWTLKIQREMPPFRFKQVSSRVKAKGLCKLTTIRSFIRFHRYMPISWVLARAEHENKLKGEQ